MGAELAGALVRAEERLRAEGLTGARAFEALVLGLRARLGDAVEASPVALSLAEAMPLEGGADLLGLAYERFFADLFKGGKGQFFTPRPLVELLIDRAGLRSGETVLDPACGSGAFLVCAGRRGAKVRGLDKDPLLVALARLNLRLAGLPGEVDHGDLFLDAPDPVDLVVANPPFSVPITARSVLDRYTLGRGRARVLSDALFVEALEGMVRPGGRAAVVMPFSLLTNPRLAPLRARLEAAWGIEAICALPEGVFRPFGGAAGRACLLWLRRGAPPGSARWAEVGDPGWDVRSKRFLPTRASELQDLRDEGAWAELPPGAWVPATRRGPGRPLRELARLGARTPPAAGPVALLDLADADRRTGEVHPRPGGEGSSRIALQPGQVLVARLRPELGNVAMAGGPAGLSLAGSPEWIPLDAPELRHYLLLALRTPTWRARLPVTGGQTRPRTSPQAVLDSVVPWPGEALARRVDLLAARLHGARARLGARLEALQAAMDAFAAGEIDDEGLGEAIASLEEGDDA